jgi:hypothetical protein
MVISLTTAAPGGNYSLFAVFIKIGHDPATIFILDDGANRDFENDILTVTARLEPAASGLSILSFVLAPIPKIEKSRDIGIGSSNHITATTAVPSVGATLGDEFLAPEGDAAVSSPAALDLYFDIIYKHFGRSLLIPDYCCFCPPSHIRRNHELPADPISGLLPGNKYIQIAVEIHHFFIPNFSKCP